MPEFTPISSWSESCTVTDFRAFSRSSSTRCSGLSACLLLVHVSLPRSANLDPPVRKHDRARRHHPATRRWKHGLRERAHGDRGEITVHGHIFDLIREILYGPDGGGVLERRHPAPPSGLEQLPLRHEVAGH